MKDFGFRGTAQAFFPDVGIWCVGQPRALANIHVITFPRARSFEAADCVHGRTGSGIRGSGIRARLDFAVPKTQLFRVRGPETLSCESVPRYNPEPEKTPSTHLRLHSQVLLSLGAQLYPSIRGWWALWIAQLRAHLESFGTHSFGCSLDLVEL